MPDILGTITLKVDPARPVPYLLRQLRTFASGASAASVCTTVLNIRYHPSTFVAGGRWNVYRVRSFVQEFWKLLPRALAALTQLRTLRYVY